MEQYKSFPFDSMSAAQFQFDNLDLWARKQGKVITLRGIEVTKEGKFVVYVNYVNKEDVSLG